MISNCGHDERGKYSSGAAGDQTGGEWAVIDWYNRPWNVILRHPNRAVGNMLAQIARAAANNNKIGYDQNQRGTYWKHLKASNYDPAQITVACEADCSSGVAANVKAVGYRLNMSALKNVSPDCYTGNLRNALKNAGFTALTASKYLNGDDYLLHGDILLYEGHHTATNLDTGSKVSGSLMPATATTPAVTTAPGVNNVAKGQKWLNSNYGALIQKSCGAKLVVDGEYGPASRAAALAVWKDLMNRKFGCKLTPSNTNFGVSCKEVANKALVESGTNGTFTYVVQFILSALGFYSGLMDASCGSGTIGAIKLFQQREGLTIDGQCGANTWYKLFN